MNVSLLLVAATVGNPPCYSCAPAYYPPKVITKYRNIKVPVYVPVPVEVKERVSYLATIVPSNTYNYTITTPAAAQVQAAALTANFTSTAAAYGVGAVQAQGYAVPGQPYVVQPPPQQQQTMPLTADQRLDRLEKAFLDACEELKSMRNGSMRLENGDGDGKMPKFFGTHCAVCHNATVADTDGGGFVLFDRGKLQPLSQLDLNKMNKHQRNQTMPPPNNKKGVPPLTPQQSEAWGRWLNQQE